jgi:hypothetical protein
MLGLLKKRRKTIDELRVQFDLAFRANDQAATIEALTELKAFTANEVQERQKHQDYAGWAILCMLGRPFDRLGEFIHWHMETYAHSLSPVRVEYAANMANQGQDDEASYFARDYLHDARKSGALARLNQQSMVWRGVSRAFLLLAAAYVRVGARGYNLRLFEHALSLPLLPDSIAAIEKERQRELEELGDAQQAKINTAWERFFSGQGAETAIRLGQWCEHQQCPLLAKRIELIDGQFRFDPNFRMDEREIYGQVVRLEGNDGPYLLRFTD